MKPEWTKAKRRNGHSVPKLWIRASGTYYAHMAILNPKTGRNVTKKICLDTKDLSVAEEKLASLISAR